VKGVTGATGATGAKGEGGSTGATGPEFEAIATFASAGLLPPGTSCLGYTEASGRGYGTCPVGISGYSPSNLLAGPAPVGGETVSDLVAETNGILIRSDYALVKVVNATTGVTLQECEINYVNKDQCEKPGVGGYAPVLSNLEVKVETTGPSAYLHAWQVRFRY
jgi:hypothetical protein